MTLSENVKQYLYYLIMLHVVGCEADGELDGPSIPHDRELAHKAFATEAECRAALSAACVRLGRGRAKAADAAGSPG